jgi:phage N-6-adenine-methyltransferase
MNKATQEIMFSSKTGEWSTPQEFFNKLNWRFGPFDLDPCATPYNTKCANIYTPIEDGLKKSWQGHTVFVNPPYGRGIDAWIKKGYEEAQDPDTKVIMLIPARTDTKYWHKYVMKAEMVFFVKGRLKFGGHNNSAPFPSAVVVFNTIPKGWSTEYPRMGALNR